MTEAMMDGAQALVKRLEMEGVEYIWGLSGGAAIPIYDALVTTGTKIMWDCRTKRHLKCNVSYSRRPG